jgi:NADP-dependent 3-hydroxy acid dehydrogenase YdfG
MAAAPIKDTMVEDWNQMIDINIKGVLHGIATALPVFQKQGFGHFINIASVAGLKVFSSGGTVYSSTKFAVRAISEGLRQEVGGDIRTTTINPGVVETELINGTTHEETSQMLSEFYKMAIQPEQIAETIAFAIQMVDTVDLNELVVRPVLQEF